MVIVLIALSNFWLAFWTKESKKRNTILFCSYV